MFEGASALTRAAAAALGAIRSALRTCPRQRAAVAALRRAADQAPRVRPFDPALQGVLRNGQPRCRVRNGNLIYNLLDDPHHRDLRQNGQEGVAQEAGRRRARRDNEDGAVQGVRRQQRRHERRARLPCRAHVDTARRSGAPTARTATTGAAKACRIAAYSSAGIADFP